MPLHLLGKKSWNVYNPDNVARVRQDEAEARAKEAEANSRRQDADSDLRLEALRGRPVLVQDHASNHENVNQEDREHRKPWDESREQTSGGLERSQRLHKDISAPLVDRDGHINLMPIHAQLKTQSARKRTPEQNQQIEGVRLADAIGYGNNAGKPWYSTSADIVQLGEGQVGKDVWGNEDPGRTHRERQRLDANDPLAAMRRGVKQLKQAEAERASWKVQREKDLVEVEELAAEHGRHSKRRRQKTNTDAESLDDFSLDDGYRADRERRVDKSSSYRRDHRPRRHHSHHHRRSKDGDRDRRRSRSPRRDKL